MKTPLLVVLLLAVLSPCFGAAAAPVPMTKMPLTGFTPLFNGKDMTGWHWSRSNRHGSIGGFRVEEGAMAIFQSIYGQGGLLMTDKRYKDFELYLETDMQSGNPGFNSGIFFRSTESGYGYQIELTGGPSTTDILTESLPGLSVPARSTPARFAEVWRTTGWNSIRFRIVGAPARMTMWLNDVQLWDVQQTQDSQLAGETDGFIGLQLHWTVVTNDTDRTAMVMAAGKPGAPLRIRNIMIKEL